MSALARWVVSCQKAAGARSTRLFHQFVFNFGAAFKYSRQVFNALLACIGSFRCAYRIRDVTCKDKSQFPGFVCGGEVSLPWDERLSFNEIDTAVLQFVYQPAAIGCVADRSRARKLRNGTVTHRSRDDHPGSEHHTVWDLETPLLQQFQV